jgi:hypothetical protein
MELWNKKKKKEYIYEMCAGQERRRELLLVL